MKPARRKNRLVFIFQTAGVVAFMLAAILAVSGLIFLVALIGAGLISGSDGDRPGWVQAIGTVLAIVSGFGAAAYQVWEQKRIVARDREAFGEAAYITACKAVDLVGDRLDSALSQARIGRIYALRGSRTTEMVAAMREFDVSRLPTAILSDFITLRSCVHAINERIGELYEAEEEGSVTERRNAMMTRYRELGSAVGVYEVARSALANLDSIMGKEPLDAGIPEHIRSYPAAAVDEAVSDEGADPE